MNDLFIHSENSSKLRTFAPRQGGGLCQLNGKVFNQNRVAVRASAVAFIQAVPTSYYGSRNC